MPCTAPPCRSTGRLFARPGKLVSNGAYRLEEWVVQSHVRLLRNRHYRDDARTVHR